MWARKKREPLVMKEGVEVRDMEGLRENFDLELILKYYKDGTLLKWLRDWHCDEEAAKVYELDEKEYNGRALCEILGVDYLGTDPEEIAWRTERLNRLKKYTSDRDILAKVDNVAFDAEDLLDILDEGKIKDIYLCGEEFILPSGFLHFTEKNYHGVGNVKIKIDVNEPIDFDALEITFENIQLYGNELKGNDVPSAAQIGIDKIESHSENKTHSAFDKFEDLQELKNAAKAGNVAAMLELGNIYLLDKDDLRHAAKWYRKAAENNVHFNDDDDDAMYLVALAFKNSIGGDENSEQSFKWMERAAETGRIDATAELGAMYLYGYGTDTDFVKAYDLIKTAVDKGNVDAMKYFGDYFIKCKKNYRQAGDWYKKAADKGHEEAQEMLEELANLNYADTDSDNIHVYSDTEAEVTVTIENRSGLHARPAALFIQAANRFPCKIHLTANGKLIDAKNMLMLMSLSLIKGTEITLYANGTGAVEAIKTLKQLIENKFGIE